MSLPYWYDKQHLPWMWPTYSHLHYSSVSDLKDKISRYPLTKEYVLEFTGKHVRTVEDGGSTRCVPVKDFKWDVFLGEDSIEQQGIGFMHEFIHAFYRCPGECVGSERPIETLIESEAECFYRTNRQFVDELLFLLKTRQ